MATRNDTAWSTVAALCIGFGAALWCHLIFTHPTAMDSNFRSETIYVSVRSDDDSVLIRDRVFASIFFAVTMATRNDTAWSTVAALCIGFGAALWCHLIFTHPTAMDSNFRSETIYVVDGRTRYVETMTPHQIMLVSSFQKFLCGLKELPTFPTLRQKQLQQVLTVLDKSPNFGTEKAAEILDILDEGIWDEEAIKTIKEKVANASEEGVLKERRGMQNFSPIVEFLPLSVWNGLQTSPSVERRVELVTRFMASLSLRCPSEPTLAAIMTLGGCLFGMNAGLTEEGKLDLLQVYKPRIRKWLSQESPPAEYLLELPARWQDLPQEILEKAYSAEDVPKLPAGMELPTIDLAVRSFPLRKSRTLAPPPPPASSADSLLAVGRLLVGALQGPERSLYNVEEQSSALTEGLS
eukprot:symbB.v1.2.039530.t1/scaffold6629.1/size22631/1